MMIYADKLKRGDVIVDLQKEYLVKGIMKVPGRRNLTVYTDKGRYSFRPTQRVLLK